MTHIRRHAADRPEAPAAVFPDRAQVLSFAALEAGANQAANAFVKLGLRRGDCIAISVTNRPEWLFSVLGAQRTGLYYVLLSTKLSAADLTFVLEDSGAKLLILSSGCFALETPNLLDSLPTPIIGVDLTGPGALDWREIVLPAATEMPAAPSSGRAMLYSSGTTGRPKGIRRPLPEGAYDTADPANLAIGASYEIGPGASVYSPSPLYHAAPHRFVIAALQMGASVVIPERFDPAATLAHLEDYRCTHGLWVPTMFHRLLALPADAREAFDPSGLRYAIHGAAPCPPHVKRAMIDWWGPILDEYYAGSEGVGSTRITSAEWLAHPGSVGRVADGAVHILDDAGHELAAGEVGGVYFASPGAFEYWKDPAKTAQATSAHGWRTIGDIGYLDADGYLYLTDRKHFTIISGGVNIYPQEIEAVLLEHPWVRDVGVIGVPSEDLGQAAKAVVQLVDGVDGDAGAAQALLQFVRQRLGPVKTPKSVSFERQLPREDTGKLFKGELVRRYSGEGAR